MSERRATKISLIAIPAAVLLFGCHSQKLADPSNSENESQSPTHAPPAMSSRASDAGPHAHKAGARGGSIVEIGRDNYHAEAVFENDVLRLYVLGRDESKVQEVESQTLTAYAKPAGGSDAVTLTLRPEPQFDDQSGKTSRFVADLPTELRAKSMEVTIPSIRIGGERFRFGFSSVSDQHEEAMPATVATHEEDLLYLTPGGKYTEADIEANGRKTASQKFHGLKSSHDMRPKIGDRICPVTLTKANAAFTWIVGGKPYEFCCPPCVDEFVKLAKEQPNDIKDPGDYVKK